MKRKIKKSTYVFWLCPDCNHTNHIMTKEDTKQLYYECNSCGWHGNYNRLVNADLDISRLACYVGTLQINLENGTEVRNV